MRQELSKREQLERLVMGLEHSIQNTKWELEYAEEGSLEKKYAQKFLDAVSQHLEKTKEELKALPPEPKA